MTISKQTIKNEIRGVINDRIDIANSCGMICSNAEYILADRDISTEHVIGELDGTPHQFLIADGKNFDEYDTNEIIIIDPTIKQFTLENKKTHDNITTAIYEKNDLCEIEIIGEKTRPKLFNKYSF